MRNFLIKMVIKLISSLPLLVFLLALLYFTGQETARTNAFVLCGKECDRTFFDPCWISPEESCVKGYESCINQCRIELHE